MIVSRKLIVESPQYDLSFESVQENRDATKRLYISGRYLMLNKKNLNGRIYEENEMLPAIKVFTENEINANRAGGELNHSEKPDMDLERLAHKIVSLTRESGDPNFFIGKSMVLSSPSGRILSTLVEDNMSFGMSSKCLGVLQESSDGNIVKSPIIVGIDAVFQPSVNTAYVRGILENREYIIGDDGRVAEAYAALDKKLSKYPSKHSDEIRAYIVENLQKFLAKI